MTRLAAFAFAVVCAGLFATGCGSDDDAVDLEHFCDLTNEAARLSGHEDPALPDEQRLGRLQEIEDELRETGPAEVRLFYVTLSTIDDLPLSDQDAAKAAAAREIASYIDERCP